MGNLKDDYRRLRLSSGDQTPNRGDVIEDMKEVGKLDRMAGYEDCPGCISVDVFGLKCNPHYAKLCPIAWKLQNTPTVGGVVAKDSGSSTDITG